MAGTVVGNLRAVLGLETAEFQKGIARASQSTKGFESAAKSMEKSLGGIQASVRGLGAAFGAISIGAAGKAFLDLANQSKQMTSQLKLATAEFGRFGKAQEDVRRIAAATGSGLSETTKLYANFNRAVRVVGGSQEDAARATETFSKALQIGGASSEEAASATLQFGQALASGSLRGDELNSVLEASPRLARLIADSLGVTIGQLRQLAADGQLTSDKLLKALSDRKFTKSIDDEFAQLPVSFDKAMTQVRNAAIITFGAFDRGGEFSEAFANFVLGGAQGLGELENAAENSGVRMRSIFEGLKDVFGPMLQGASEAFGSIEQRANYTRDTIASLLSGIDQMRNFLPELQNRANAFDRKWFGGTTFFAKDAPLSNLSGDFLKRTSAAATDLRLKSIMRGNPMRDYKGKGPVSKGVPIAGAPGGGKKGSASGGKKTEKDWDTSTPTDWSIFNFKEAMNDALDQPLDFTTINKSVDLGLDYMQNRFRTTAEVGSEAMVNLVNNSLNALNGFAQSLKSGGFLDILSNAFNAFGAISKAGLFGKGLAGTFKDFSGISGFAGVRAAGGPVTAGRSYVVGERGPELFTATRSGYIHPNGANDNGSGGRPYFDLRGAVMTADLLAQMNAIGDVAAARGASGGAFAATKAQIKKDRYRLA